MAAARSICSSGTPWPVIVRETDLFLNLADGTRHLVLGLGVIRQKGRDVDDRHTAGLGSKRVIRTHSAQVSTKWIV